MLFNKIKDKDFEYISSIQKNTQFNGSEWSKLYLQSWDFFDYPSMEIATKNDIVLIRFKPNHYTEFFEDFSHIYLPPICTLDKVKEAIDLAMNQAKLDGEVFGMISVPQEYLDCYENPPFTYTLIDSQNEYLYNTLDLVEFKGKKYHSKRNHIAVFDRLYNYEFRRYKDEDREAVEDLLFRWTENQKEVEITEFHAIKRSLEMANEENIYPYVLYVDGKLAGFTLGEITPSNVGIVHIEKADITFNGVYSKLVNLFASEVLKDCRIINRQEDMGDEGLRQSKLSYKPCGYAMKYFLKA